MPLYLHETDKDRRGFRWANDDKALEKDLRFRLFEETIRGVLDWRKDIISELKSGLSVEREKELHRKWRK